MDLTIERFRYNQLNNQLWVLPKGREWQEITTKEKSKYHGWYWAIDPYNKNHWIQTIIRQDRIDVFYRLSAGQQTIYYKKHLPRLDEQDFFFDFQDIQERQTDEKTGREKWVFKHKPKADFSKG